MTLIKGINSLADVAEADGYFELRLDAESWTNAAPARKAASLVTATTIFNGLTWDGVALSESQECAFPRRVCYFEPTLGYEIRVEGTPGRIFKGLCEMALHLLMNENLLSDTGGVSELEVASLGLKNIRQAALIPEHVVALLKPLRAKQRSRAWRREN